MPLKKADTSVSVKSEAHPREESSVEAASGIPKTQQDPGSVTDVAPEASETQPASPASNDVPSPLTPAFVAPMTYEEFTNSIIFKDANFPSKISLISVLYGPESAWEYINQVNKMESNGGAAATLPLLTNLHNGDVATTIGGMPNPNQGLHRKRGFEMNALATQNSEIEALEEEFLKKRRAHQELLKVMIVKADAQLAYDKAFLREGVAGETVKKPAGEKDPESSGH
ncbi:hypothetical protein CAEBREN_20028 [Caenorhabditis brenneri]|uniref:Uncharacterized protein n=1 Tax=Caenorhabditis brenneri TaxID=135651 RepID=G0MCN6_CAEBE|nr:hypothetical protein CAEBREN_20028 [Caenorhabditis brenneri]